MNDKSATTRRGFVKRSAAMLAGVGLGQWFDVGRVAHAAGAERLRVALIGCGGRGTGAAANCLMADPAVRLAALADVFSPPIAKCAALLKDKFRDRLELNDRLFVGVSAYQHAIDSGVDLVIIASPGVFHPQQYEAAVRAGKHVFVEKPCCVDAPGYRLVVETNKLADQKGLKVGVGFNRRHQPDYIESIRRVHDGAIGKVRSFDACWKGGGIWTRQREPDQTEMQWQVYNWINFAWASGDQICERLTHNLDICNWIQRGHPVRAVGRGGREARYDPLAGDVLDFFDLDYAYADGTQLHAECYWIQGRYNRVGEHATGASGAWTAGRITGQNEWRYTRPSAGLPNPFQEEHVALIAAMRSGARYNLGPDGADTSMTAILGRMAAYEGREVTWDEAVQSKECYHPERFAWDADPPTLPDKFGCYRVPFRTRTIVS